MAIKSNANRRAVAKYKKENYDQIQLRVPRGDRDRLKNHAEAHGESLNAFINRAITETVSRDGTAAEEAQA